MESLLLLEKIPVIWLIEAFVFITGVATALHALLHKREPRAALLWIVICLFIPLLGPILYLLLGINRIHRIQKRGAVKTTSHTSFAVPGRPNKPQQDCMPYPEHVLLASTVTGLPLSEGNRVELLTNGEEAYPAMLDAIKCASSWIYLCIYIFEHKEIGRQFIDALTNAVARGVEVRVLLDGIGAWYSFGQTFPMLKAQNVKVAYFLPPRLVPPQLGINLRNHRKILITDDMQGFVGGMNIRQCHLTKTTHPKRAVRDTMFRLQGSILKQVCRVFEDDWLYACGERLPKRQFKATHDGESWCRAITDGPGLHLDTLIKILVGAIGSARHSIEIKTPYFLPPGELISALQSAALRGVEVSVLLPAQNNLPYVHWAMRNMLWQLLQYGIRIYYQPAPFDHSKWFVIDKHYCQIGSANLDARSLRLNFELTVEVYDSKLGEQLSNQLKLDRQASKEITRIQLDSRPLSVRMWDAFWWLFTPYL